MSTLASTDMKYVGETNQHLLCPICLSPFLIPVTSSTCLHTYCRSCVTEALTHARICPVDRRPLRLTDLEPANPIIQSLVNELYIECPYAGDGCPKSKLRRDALNSHLEDECMHTPTTCPIPGCQTKLPLVDMFEHQEMHLMQIQAEDDELEASLTQSNTSFPTPHSPDRGSDDEDYFIVSPQSSSDRSERLLRLNRNWSVLSRLSGSPSRRPRRISARRAVPRDDRPLPALPNLDHSLLDFPFLVRATNAYASTDERELSIQPGDIIKVTGIQDEGWYEGNHIDANYEGTFLVPRMFTEPFPLATRASSPVGDPVVELDQLSSSAQAGTSREREPAQSPLGRSMTWGALRSRRSPTQRTLAGARPRSSEFSSYPTPIPTPDRPDHHQRPPSTSQSLSSMYTDDLTHDQDVALALQLTDEPSTFEPVSPPRRSPTAPARLSPVRLRRRQSHSGPSELLERADGVLYYVQASGNHRASEDDDFDFQEGDVMAVTDMSGGEMHGYLLDDERRRDHVGRNRIPSDRVVLFY